MNHDSSCQADDQKVLDDVAEYGWHVIKIPPVSDTPGWAFSIGLYRTFHHPEIVVFGLNHELMHSIINSIGSEIKSGKSFKPDTPFSELIEGYDCILKKVKVNWYSPFLGYANWFYQNTDYPALQCVWPDKKGCYPWDPAFDPNWLWAQPLLYEADSESARTVELLQTLDP
jgi:uncharacterized protein DUF4262